MFSVISKEATRLMGGSPVVVRAIFTTVPVEVVFKPVTQRGKLADCDLVRYLRMRFAGGGIELGTENIADRVALKCAADAAGKPVYVLQAAVAVVSRHKAERGRHLSTPGLREIFDPQAAI